MYSCKFVLLFSVGDLESWGGGRREMNATACICSIHGNATVTCSGPVSGNNQWETDYHLQPC